MEVYEVSRYSDMRWRGVGVWGWVGVLLCQSGPLSVQDGVRGVHKLCYYSEKTYT